ncbi:unnamed protein product, partial [Prorocentrum cordatum]
TLRSRWLKLRERIFKAARRTGLAAGPDLLLMDPNIDNEKEWGEWCIEYVMRVLNRDVFLPICSTRAETLPLNYVHLRFVGRPLLSTVPGAAGSAANDCVFLLEVTQNCVLETMITILMLRLIWTHWLLMTFLT